MDKINNLNDNDFLKYSEYNNYFINNKNTIKENHILFGDIIITKIDNTNQEIFKLEKVISNKNEMASEIINAKYKMNIINDNILKLLDYSTSIQNNWCSKFYIIQYYFEYPKNDLYKEIENRKKSHNFFNENELISILNHISISLKYLQENNLNHGDIRPENIVCDFSTYKFKIIDSFDKNRNPIKTQKINFQNINKDLYINQEVYTNIINKKNEVDFNINKSDTFSFGLILLEAALLESVQGIYGDRKQIEINYNLLNEYINKIEYNYDKKGIFCIALKAIILENIDCLQLYEGLENFNYNYEEDINIDIKNNYKEQNIQNNYNQSNNPNNNINNINNIEDIKSNSHIGKVTVYRYRIDKNGNKELIEEPQITENNMPMTRVSKTFVNEPITQISRTYTNEGKINFTNITPEDIQQSNNLVNDMIPSESRTYIGEPITKNDNHVQYRNSKSYKNDLDSKNFENESKIRLSRTFQNEPIVRLSRTFQNEPENKNYVKSNYYHQNNNNNVESIAPEQKIVKIMRYKLDKDGNKTLMSESIKEDY